jgi:hypothetical protein
MGLGNRLAVRALLKTAQARLAEQVPPESRRDLGIRRLRERRNAASGLLRSIID